MFLFSFNKSVPRTLCGHVRSRRRLFVKGDRKKKDFLFFCVLATFMKRSNSVQAVSSILDCSLPSGLSNGGLFSTTFHTSLPFTVILSLPLSLSFSFNLASPPTTFPPCSLLPYCFCHFLSAHTFSLSLPFLHSLLLGPEDNFFALMLLFHSSGDLKST